MKNKEEIENKIEQEIENKSQNNERQVELYTGYGNDLYHSFIFVFVLLYHIF